jgi:hypothetical protein
MKQRTLSALAAAMALGLTVANAAPKPADAPARAERLPVKPGGPIAVEYRAGAEPSVGTPLEISITAHVEAGVGNVTIEAYPSMPGAVLVTQPDVVARGDGLYSWTITVVPLAADAGYLSVVVSGQVEGLTQARSVTVPLGSPAPAGGAASAQPTDGETLIALPVQEGP